MAKQSTLHGGIGSIPPSTNAFLQTADGTSISNLSEVFAKLTSILFQRAMFAPTSGAYTMHAASLPFHEGRAWLTVQPQDWKRPGPVSTYLRAVSLIAKAVSFSLSVPSLVRGARSGIRENLDRGRGSSLSSPSSRYIPVSLPIIPEISENSSINMSQGHRKARALAVATFD